MAKDRQNCLHHLWFCREDERRCTGRFQLADFFESGFFQPALDFVEAESVALLRVHQHLNGKHERAQRFGALVVHQPFGDRDDAALFQRAESFLEQLATAIFAFAV